MKDLSMKLTLGAIFLLAIGIFTSISISAGSHILLSLGIVLYAIDNPKGYFKSLLVKKHMSLSLFLLIIALLISILGNWDILSKPTANLSKLKYLIIPLLSLPLLKEFFKDYLSQKRVKNLVLLFILATTIASISGIIGLYTGFNPIKLKAACHETRACGLYGMYMTYGYGISLFMILISGLVLNFKAFKCPLLKTSIALGWVVNFVGLILSYARGGILGFLIGFPFYFFKKNQKKFLLLIVFSFISLGSAILISPKLQDTFFKRGYSNQQRIAFYETALRAFQEKPVLGWGHKNFEPNVTALKTKYKIPFPEFAADAHNIYLEVLATSGIFGILSFIYFILAWLFTAYKEDTFLHKLSFPFVISFGTLGLVQNVFGDGENLFLIMFMWSILASYQKLTEASDE